VPAVPRLPVSNDLLAAFSRRRRGKPLAGVESVVVNFGDVLMEPGRPIRHVYFPGNSVVSLLVEIGRRAAEVGMVGREGMIGIPLAFGGNASPVRAVVQRAGTVARMSRASFLGELRNSKAMRRAVYGYSNSLMSQLAQLSACNRLHATQSRLARSLLMTRDRLRAPRFALTHEFLGYLLGVRRVGITQAAGALQRKGLITYSRGTIELVDESGLEAAACPCYRAIKRLHAKR
jgi:CRP-like cAMP-binding protein